MSPQLPTVLLRAQTDERLARLAALGSERAFEAIVERYRRPLMGYARRLVGESRAEDVVQAAFVSAWAKLEQGAEVRELRAWLFRIVHNGSINVLKRASARDVELFEDTPALDDLQGEVERRESMRDALDGIASLPLQQREALLGVAVQGRRHRDVGADLGVTDGAVRMLLHRARTNMRTAATALTPWPLLAWLAGDRGAETAAGAGAGVLAGGALKTAALLSTAAVAVTAAPQIAGHVTRHHAPARDGGAQSAATASAAATSSVSLASSKGFASAGMVAHSKAAPRVKKRHVVSHTIAPAPTTTAPVAAVQPSAPVAAAPAAPPAGVVEQHDVSTTLPQPQVHKQVVRPAREEDDDEISVLEEPPDLAAGERPIPADGVPDAIADAALPEQPAAAADQAELDAEADQQAPEQEANASASAADEPSAAAPTTP